MMKMTGPIKVIDIELSSPIEDMDGLDRYVSIQALVRLHGKPLGYAFLPVAEGCCRAEAILKSIIKGLGDRLIHEGIGLGNLFHKKSQRLIFDPISTAQSKDEEKFCPLVTVAVCTRNRSRNLKRCLHAIQRLDYPCLDILIVDNAPRNDTVERLIRSEFPGARSVVEPRPGLDWARNRAILEARGEIIAFTDDDVAVDPKWVQSLVKVFVHDSDVMAVTGLVVPYELETEAQILFESYGGFSKGFDKKRFSRPAMKNLGRWSHLPAGDLGTGANMAFRRSVFERIGPFDVALDTGTPTTGGGDLEMFFRLIHEGYTLVYEPSAIVRHIHRREYDSLKTQIRSWGTAFMAYLMRSAIAYPQSRPLILYFALKWLIGRHLIRPLDHLLRGRPIPLDLVLEELFGSFAGLFAYHQALRTVKKIEAGFGPMV